MQIPYLKNKYWLSIADRLSLSFLAWYIKYCFEENTHEPVYRRVTFLRIRSEIISEQDGVNSKEPINKVEFQHTHLHRYISIRWTVLFCTNVSQKPRPECDCVLFSVFPTCNLIYIRKKFIIRLFSNHRIATWIYALF
jgi:hypothetical protein